MVTAVSEDYDAARMTAAEAIDAALAKAGIEVEEALEWTRIQPWRVEAMVASLVLNGLPKPHSATFTYRGFVVGLLREGLMEAGE